MTWLLHGLVVLGLLLAPGGRPYQNVTVMGATSLISYARAAIAAWAPQHPDARVALSGGGSYAGWYALRAGDAEIALSDIRFATGRSVRERILGKMPILFVANRGAGVSEVTRLGLARIFQGRVRNWRDLGGTRQAIHIIARPAGSGARAVVAQALGKTPPAVAQIVQLSNGAVVRAVEQTPGAIGYVEGDRAWPGVVTLSVNGFAYSRPQGQWPFYARPRIYWRTSAPPVVQSLAATLATSHFRRKFGILPAPSDRAL